jgi:hypothetical protein
MANSSENTEVLSGTLSSADESSAVAADDLMELEFTPLPPEEASALEDRVYLLGARHGVRPF